MLSNLRCQEIVCELNRDAYACANNPELSLAEVNFILSLTCRSFLRRDQLNNPTAASHYYTALQGLWDNPVLTLLPIEDPLRGKYIMEFVDKEMIAIKYRFERCRVEKKGASSFVFHVWSQRKEPRHTMFTLFFAQE